MDAKHGLTGDIEGDLSTTPPPPRLSLSFPPSVAEPLSHSTAIAMYPESQICCEPHAV